MKQTLETIVGIIKQMQEVSSSNAKKEILQLNGQPDFVVETFKKILDYTYNPRYAYNISLDKELMESLEPRKTKHYETIFDYAEALKIGELTGNAAIMQFLHIKETASQDEIFILERIIDRSLNCGISITTINKVYPNLIPDLGYMRCVLPTAMSDKDWAKWNMSETNPNIVQEKMDGMFVNISCDENYNMELFTRNSIPIPLTDSLKEITDALKQGLVHLGINQVFLHGEILIKYSQEPSSKYLPREESNGIINSIIQSATEVELEGYYPHFVLWDIISFADMETGKGKETYSERFAKLNSVVSNAMAFTKNATVVNFQFVDSLDKAQEFAKNAIKRGGEGAVYKNANGIWKNGNSKDNVKLKLSFEVELEIIGFTEGTGRNEQYFGAIVCQSADKKLEVNVSVSGFKDEMKEKISQDKDSYIGKILTVKANNLFDEDLSTDTKATLFLPVFVEFRADKNEANTLAEIKEIFTQEKES